MPVKYPTLEQRLALRERPAARCVMRQVWRELLFLHWRYEPGEIQRLLPPGLTVDCFDGAAWVGIVPFFMCGVCPVWCPPMPGLSNFLELNVRTYVHDEKGVPGVWFFSLDASNAVAVFLARTFFGLPYYRARMRARATPATLDYWSQRGELPPDHFVYQPVGPARFAEAGSLEFFLAERYLLYSYDAKAGRLSSGRVHHRPYPLQDVKVLEHSTHLLAPAGLSQVTTPFDHAVYAREVDVEIFGLRHQ
ncbi:MAG TPA: DUF2071 domain-containing protein [Chthoniobacterales bacterium]|jgi:hypothetical protein